MVSYDAVNATLEVVSVFMLLPTIIQAFRTKLVVGLHWSTPSFFAGWNYWNAIFWYPHLNQPGSWIGSIIMSVANTVWVVMIFRYTPSEYLTLSPFGPFKRKG